MKKAAAVLLLLALPLPLAPEAPLNLSEKALALARELRVDRMGVDHEDNLWTWEHASGRIQVYAPSGELVGSASVSKTAQLTADRRTLYFSCSCSSISCTRTCEYKNCNP